MAHADVGQNYRQVVNAGQADADAAAPNRETRCFREQASDPTEVAVGSAGGAGAVRSCRLAWFPPAADIEPCMRFSRTRLPDVLHRWAFSVPVATGGWVAARRWFR